MLPAPRRACLPIAALAALPYLLLAGGFWFLCDDAFISFRYARNLALGHGLVWHPDDPVPVEGYSNLLWVLWLAGLDHLGWEPTTAAPATSLACGLTLLVLVARSLGRWTTSRLATGGAVAFLALLPAVAVWSTSGLEVMPATLLGWCTFAQVFGPPVRPRGVAAGTAGLGLLLLRPEAVGLLALWLLLLARDSSPAARTALRRMAAVLAIGVAALLAWRLSYYGDWLPQTVRAKGGFAAFRLHRGLLYVASFLLVFPGVALALGAAPAGARHPERRHLAAAALWTIAAQTVFAVYAGGDFMTMGRFLVPALPFVALTLGLALDRMVQRGAVPLAVCLAAVCALANLPAAFGHHLVPAAVREACHFRWSRPPADTELDAWRLLRDGVRNDEILARALLAHTEPGQTLIREAIGVVAYRTHLRVLDTFALVTRRPAAEHTWLPASTPGHDRMLSWHVFLPERPDFASAQLAEPGAPLDNPMVAPPFARSALADLVRVERVPLVEPDVHGRAVELRLYRFHRWDDPLAGLGPLLAAVAGLDPAQPDAAVALRGRLPEPDAATRATLRRQVELRHLAPRGELPFRHGRVADAIAQSRGFAVEATVQTGAGVDHGLPRGKFVYLLALDGTPTLDGQPPGWITVEPTPLRRDRVTGGTALLLHFMPGGAVTWGG